MINSVKNIFKNQPVPMVAPPPVPAPMPVPSPMPVAPVPVPETKNPYSVPFNAPPPTAHQHRSPFTVTTGNPLPPPAPPGGLVYSPPVADRPSIQSGWKDEEPPARVRNNL